MSGLAFEVQVEVDLLRLGWIGPGGWLVPGSELYAERPAAVDPDGMPVVAPLLHRAVQERRPERAFGVQIGSVEHDHPMLDLHPKSLAARTDLRQARASAMPGRSGGG